MRGLTICAALLPSLVLWAACSGNLDVKEARVKLRNYETEKLRTNHFRDIHTDEDSRARPPTKYADATKGLLTTIRHTATTDDGRISMCTWIFESQSARDASKKGPFQQILDDLIKAGTPNKAYAIDHGDLHMILYFESPSAAMDNQFQLLYRAVEQDLDEVVKR